MGIRCFTIEIYLRVGILEYVTEQAYSLQPTCRLVVQW